MSILLEASGPVSAPILFFELNLSFSFVSSFQTQNSNLPSCSGIQMQLLSFSTTHIMTLLVHMPKLKPTATQRINPCAAK
jgi:hypothetical protein